MGTRITDARDWDAYSCECGATFATAEQMDAHVDAVHMDDDSEDDE